MALIEWLDLAKAGISAMAMREMTKQPREEGINRLTLTVQNMTEDQFDQFEAEFLDNSLLLIDAKKRIRAMELYAVLKLLEIQKFGQFRGFANYGGALE